MIIATYTLVAVVALVAGVLIGITYKRIEIEVLTEELEQQEAELERYALNAVTARDAMKEAIAVSEEQDAQIQRYRETVRKMQEVSTLINY